MGLYETYLLPGLVHCACALRSVRRQREKIVPLAEGRVLEIGIGSGLNLPHYRPDKVEILLGLDPSRTLWGFARQRLGEAPFDVEFIEASAEEIPLPGNSVDTVLLTYTLCTIPDVRRALAEMRRVLKPDGILLFCEHGLAPDASVCRWQNRLNPLWKRVAGGCHMNRPIGELVERAGFGIVALETGYIPGWKPVCFNFLGRATRR